LQYDDRTGSSKRLTRPTGENGPVHFAPPSCPTDSDRMQIGRSAFAIHRDMLVEYDVTLAAPLGVVLDGLEHKEVRVCGNELHVVDRQGRVLVVKSGAHGRFMRVFEPNPLREQALSA
jgi:hypothetical protein